MYKKVAETLIGIISWILLLACIIVVCTTIFGTIDAAFGPYREVQEETTKNCLDLSSLISHETKSGYWEREKTCLVRINNSWVPLEIYYKLDK